MDKPSPHYIYPACALTGGTLAQLTIPNPEDKSPYRHTGQQLTIVTASTMDEPGGYCPAESVRVIGKEALVALRDFLNTHIKD